MHRVRKRVIVKGNCKAKTKCSNKVFPTFAIILLFIHSQDFLNSFIFKKINLITFRSYEAVPWDNMLPPRKWAPVSTLEDRPDMISQVWTNKRYDPDCKEWQAVGRSWDWFQARRSYWKDGPIPGTVL